MGVFRFFLVRRGYLGELGLFFSVIEGVVFVDGV